MLTIRLQRTGRTGHAQFRVVAQDKRFSPFSGRVTAYLGSYDPHTKAAQLDSQKISDYLDKGAQPSPRVIRLLKAEGIKLPKWAVEPPTKKKAIRNPEKLRKNRPAEPKAEKPAAEAPAETAEVPSETTAEAPADQPAMEAPDEEKTAKAESTEDKPAEAAKTEEKTAEAPAEKKSEDPAGEAAKPEAPAAEAPADDKPAES